MSAAGVSVFNLFCFLFVCYLFVCCVAWERGRGATVFDVCVFN